MGNCTSKQSKESKGERYTPSKQSNNDPQTSDGNNKNLPRDDDQQTKPGYINSQLTFDGSTKQILAQADIEAVTSVTDEKLIKPEGMITASIAEAEDLEAPKENVNKEHKLEETNDKHMKEKLNENSNDGTKFENQQDLVKDGQFPSNENLKNIDSDEGEKNPTGPSEGEDIVRVDMITVKTGNQDGENRNFTSSTISTIEKPESRDWEFAQGKPGEEAEVESEFLDMKKHQTKGDMGDTSWNKRNNPEMNAVNQHGNKKTDEPIAGNGSQLGSVPDCNQSPRHDMKPSTTGSATYPKVQPTTESSTYSNDKQNPGSNNGYKNSQFAEPKSGQNSHKKLPSQGKMDSSKNDKKKKKKKDDPWAVFDNFKEMSKKGNPVIYVEYMEQMNIGCKSTTINNNATSIYEREKKQQIQPTEVMTFECISALRNVAKSVGYLHGRIKSGTCWRVGEDKIITAYHVVRDNILTSAQQILHEHLLKDICIDFEYIGEQSGESEKWKVEENLLFYDENLDVAVLKLKRNENQTLPPPLNVFKRLNPAIHVDEKIYLISHNKGRQKELNYGIGLFEPTKSQMEKLEKFCDEYGEENGYVGLDSEERLVIQCKFEGGASGSPGIVLYNNIPHVVLMYLRGYPTFYYKQQFHEDSKRNFPQEKILQQGVNICSLYDTMGANPLHLNLMNEIFRREPEPKLKVNPQRNVYAMTGDGRDGANINLQTTVSAPPIEHDNIGNQQVQSQVVNQEDYAPQYGRQLSQCLPSGKRQEFQMPGGHPKKKASPVLPIDSVSGPTEGNSGILQNTSAPVFDSDCAELPYLDKHIQLNKISSSSKVLPNVTLEEWIGQDPEVLPGIELEDRDLMFVSQAINSQAWNGVGLEFHLRQPDLDKIESGSQNDKSYNMLYKWKNKNGKNATLRKCVEHLFDAWLKDNKKVYIDKLKDAIQRILKK